MRRIDVRPDSIQVLGETLPHCGCPPVSWVWLSRDHSAHVTPLALSGARFHALRPWRLQNASGGGSRAPGWPIPPPPTQGEPGTEPAGPATSFVRSGAPACRPSRTRAHHGVGRRRRDGSRRRTLAGHRMTVCRTGIREIIGHPALAPCLPPLEVTTPGLVEHQVAKPCTEPKRGKAQQPSPTEEHVGNRVPDDRSSEACDARQEKVGSDCPPAFIFAESGAHGGDVIGRRGESRVCCCTAAKYSNASNPARMPTTTTTPPGQLTDLDRPDPRESVNTGRRSEGES